MKEPTTYTKPNADHSKPAANAVLEAPADPAIAIDKGNAELADEQRSRVADDQQPGAADPEASTR